MSGLLSITFRGPFVFSVQANTVDIYAPKCDGHLAGIFWTDGEYPLEGTARCGDKHTYTISGAGITPNAGTILQMGGVPGKVATGSPKTSLAFFHISVPRPKIIYGMNKDTVEIVTAANPTGTRNDYATGLRFYYDWNVTTRVMMAVPSYPNPPIMGTPVPALKDITPPAGAPLPEYGDIEIQYDGPGSSDPDHLDAVSCFDQLAQLAGVPWWLCYYNPGGSGASLRTGSDCRAVPLAFGI